MRLGIFGGTFDPPHVGHLLAASDAFEHLSLDRLVFVPAWMQPLKAGRATTPAHHRLAMVRLLTAGDDRFATDPVEVDREGLSYSVETLRGFAQQYPTAQRFFLVGADVLTTFAQWREPREVLALATLAVLTRRDEGGTAAMATSEPAPRAPSDHHESGEASALQAELRRQTVLVPTRRIDVSSTEIRDRVRCNRSIHGFVTDAVAGYIGSHGLYR